jgi:hypothetical protein
VRESEIENHLKDQFQLRGWRTYKWVSPGLRGVADQICLAHIPPKHRALIARYVRFVEVKAPGETPESHQLREHKRMRDMGQDVRVIDSIDQVEGIFG